MPLVHVLVLMLGLQAAEVPPPAVTAALDRITADSLRGHLSFLAADLLEGRKTPSRGLDLAALYIASQFRRAGLEPVGDDGYFQTASWVLRKRSGVGFQARLANGKDGAAERSLRLEDLSVDVEPAAALADVPLIKVEGDLASVPDETLRGRAVVIGTPPGGNPRERRERAGNLRRAAATKGVKIILTLDRQGRASGLRASELVNPDDPGGDLALVRLHGDELLAWFEALPAGATDWRLSLEVGERTDEPMRMWNVAGLLRGSDPELSQTHVIVSAHYDHLGTRTAAGDGDQIYNGANDDGSGTVSVIEIAAAMARIAPAPRRSILFLTFFGEEMGSLGARHYIRHPLLPLDRTIANVNLEQVGRTDDSEGSTAGVAMMTGVDYSEVTGILAAAGQSTGIEFRRHATNSDAYFTRSDNAAFALAGIPAHTLCTAFSYPDYHGPGDHWDKIDYENMVKVDRAVALGLWTLANVDRPPQWIAGPRTERFLEAWRKLHP